MKFFFVENIYAFTSCGRLQSCVVKTVYLNFDFVFLKKYLKYLGKAIKIRFPLSCKFERDKKE